MRHYFEGNGPVRSRLITSCPWMRIALEWKLSRAEPCRCYVVGANRGTGRMSQLGLALEADRYWNLVMVGNFSRRLVLSKRIDSRSLSSLQQRLSRRAGVS